MTIIRLICEIAGAIAIFGGIAMGLTIKLTRIAEKLRLLDELEKDYEDDF